MNFCRVFFRPCLNRMLSPTRTGKLTTSLIVGVLTTVGLSGLTPNLSGTSVLVFGSAVSAQAVSDAEVTNYAQAVLAMEPVRQQSYDEIKKIIGSGDMPSIVCHKTESLTALPDSARTIAMNYCNRSKVIVESNKLSVPRFNAITVSLQSDPDLKARIHSELIRIQSRSASGSN